MKNTEVMFLIVYRLVPECKEKLDSANTLVIIFEGKSFEMPF